MDSLRADIRSALRWVLRAPLFTITSLVILGIGTGVASGNFGIIQHLLGNPYPVPVGGRLIMVSGRVLARGELRGAMSGGRLTAYRGARSLERLEAFAYDEAVLRTGEGARSLIAVRATPGLFATLGVRMRA